MYVTCGSERIGVTVENDILDDEGHPTYGLFRVAQGIVLDSSTPPQERRSVLVHELSHAYEHRFGRVDPDDREGRQNRVATIESQFARDLDKQGGEGILHRLFGDDGSQVPFEDPDNGHYTQTDDDMAEWPTSIWCPSCNTQYPSRAVRNGKPGFNPRLNGFMVMRILVCGKCGRETEWGQRCTYEGLALPEVVVSSRTRSLPAMA